MALSQYNSLAPLNCDSSLGTNDRCPHCGYFHLRPGYCWNLDAVNNPNNEPVIPVNKSVDKPVHKEQIVHIPVHRPEPEIEPDDEVIDAAEKRKRYRREWMRKKREEKSSG